MSSPVPGWLEGHRRPRAFRRSRRGEGRYRPGVERLEGRTVLSTIFVTGTSDVPAPLVPVGSVANAYDCASLRSAVLAADAAAGPDTIVVPAGDYKLRAGNGALSVTQSLTIQGTNPALTLIDAAGLGDRVIHVSGAGVNVGITGVTIEDGDAGQGGGVLNDGGATLTLTTCVVTGNVAAAPAGSKLDGIGGGIDNALGSTLDLVNTTVTKNKATGDTLQDGQGGGVYNAGTASIVKGSISANVAQGGGMGEGQGGGVYNASTGTLTSSYCTVSGNSADGGTGGGFLVFTDTVTNTDAGAAGTAVANATADAKATADANTAEAQASATTTGTGTATAIAVAVAGSGGDGAGGGLFNAGSATVDHPTVLDNQAVGGNGGGVGSSNVAAATAVLDGEGTVTAIAEAGSGGDGDGGGLFNDNAATLNVTAAAIWGNAALGGAGGSSGGANVSVATATVTGGGSPAASASATAQSGNGGNGLGGGLLNEGTAAVSGSLFLANSATGGNGGAGGPVALPTAVGPGTATAVAQAGNGGAGEGGGADNEGNGSLTLPNDLMVSNVAAGGLAGTPVTLAPAALVPGAGTHLTVLGGIKGAQLGASVWMGPAPVSTKKA